MRLSGRSPPLVRISWDFVPVGSWLNSARRPRETDGVRLDAELEHQSPDWAAIEKHLPDPATASAKQLEMQGDILRARRFPEDALDYYGYALRRGANLERSIRSWALRIWSCITLCLPGVSFRRR